MEVEKMKAIIEAILFSAGRVVKINELILVLEKNEEEIQNIIENMQEDYKKDNRGIEIIKNMKSEYINQYLFIYL